jgi:hypothetical protein
MTDANSSPLEFGYCCTASEFGMSNLIHQFFIISTTHIDFFFASFSKVMLKLPFAILLVVSHFESANGKDSCALHPPPKYAGVCAPTPSLATCKGHELVTWKVYQDMKNMAATAENLKFYNNVLFLPIQGQTDSLYNNQEVHRTIDDEYNADLGCIKNSLLDAYCSIVYLKKADPWISKILPFMKPGKSMIAPLITKAELKNIFIYVPNIPSTSITGYGAIQGLSAIRERFYYSVLVNCV